eukprot:Selendium_serpulae@DN4751_c0_g1_i3.p1
MTLPCIGWVGCGLMGRSMCSHLLEAGYKLTVFSRTISKCDALKEKGASVAADLPAVSRAADIVFLMVGHPHDVDQVVFGLHGLLPAIRPGQVLVDMTTSEPRLAQRVAEAAGQRGAAALDAPVSGGDVGARQGTLAIMVGGAEEAFERVAPLFNIMGKNVNLMGGPGMGQHTKMANQILIATNMIGVCESLLYAQRMGLDPSAVLAAVRNGAADSWSLQTLGPRMIDRNFEPGFLVEHFVKDMEIALDEAQRANLALPGLALAHQLYLSLKAHGNAGMGTQALLLVLESMSNFKPENRRV